MEVCASPACHRQNVIVVAVSQSRRSSETHSEAQEHKGVEVLAAERSTPHIPACTYNFVRVLQEQVDQLVFIDPEQGTEAAQALAGAHTHTAHIPCERMIFIR
jgi:hypothetical protein